MKEAKPKRQIPIKKAALIVAVIVLALLVAAKSYLMPPDLSYKDFVTVQQRVDSFFDALNVTSATKDKYCVYDNISSDEKVADYRLSCSISQSISIPTASHQEFEELGTRLEKHASILQADVPISLQDWQGRDYYHEYAAFRVKGAGHLMSCHINLKGGDGSEAQSASRPLDKSTVELSCGGLAKAPYFKVRDNTP